MPISEADIVKHVSDRLKAACGGPTTMGSELTGFDLHKAIARNV